MGKAFAVGLAVVAALVIGTFAGAARAAGNFDCDEAWSLCAEPVDSIGYAGEYTGHDEPSLLFYSNQAGSGNSSIYNLTLPDEPRVLPNQAGTGGTWNFQLRPAFWLGMALCDNQSAPEYTHAECVRDSDTNIKDGSDPAQPDYIGYHAGTAFLELQFYPPGWAPWPAGISCDARKWCAAMAMFSLNNDYNNGVANNDACLGSVGIEPVNFAFITLSGLPHAPPSPLEATGDTFTPHSSSDLFMGSGDKLVVDIHDSTAGLVTVIRDLTTGQTGSMVASVANGFAQINFEPGASECTQSPYAFHPMYATASEHTRVPWAAHTYNVAFSDEIGHFDYCSSVPVDTGPCADPGADEDLDYCFSAASSLLVPIGGCAATDNDFDGSSYQTVWPGTDPNRGQDVKYHPTSVEFSSPLFNGTRTSTVSPSRPTCRGSKRPTSAASATGTRARTASTRRRAPTSIRSIRPARATPRTVGMDRASGTLAGGTSRGTTNTFGGNSTAEYGDLLLSNYPNTGFVPRFRYNNFRQVLNTNPCAAN